MLTIWQRKSVKVNSSFWGVYYTMDTYNWYAQLIKPSWAPPAWLFGPAWTVLYILIAISFGKVFLLAWQKKIAFKTALPFALNLIFNFAFSPLQFRLQNNILAAIDVLFVLATLIWAMRAIYPHARWITYIQIPYLLWVSFATVLQLTVTYLNR
ncbi:MAG TPA: tryptophan-rich sensory protein [Candidatus Jacksonbacteria bacterium]|nr:tryptophan-rich sensory protein [Candidatus Jacksonbacteria bacterium]HCE49595.1 tryptophan-rich sensory protein [Candidatus Jacksonbacteria bacterium]HCR15732.1 tryptophan-rich sensory protein [Candidatus Jacksonbacteria bacterium]